MAAKSRDLIHIETVVATRHVVSLNRIASVGPTEDTGVVETTVAELLTVDRVIGPNLIVGVVGALSALLCFMEGLLPLEHLDLALQSITVLSNDAKVPITQIDLVVNFAAHVY